MLKRCVTRFLLGQTLGPLAEGRQHSHDYYGDYSKSRNELSSSMAPIITGKFKSKYLDLDSYEQGLRMWQITRHNRLESDYAN